MESRSILFLILGIGALIAISVVLNFWLYLMIAFAAVIVIGAVLISRTIKDLEGRFMRIDFSTPMWDRPVRDNNGFERKLRNKIENEWERQPRFGSEDLDGLR